MTPISQNIQTAWAYLRAHGMIPFAITLAAIALLSTGIAYLEYQTNFFAKRLGTLLLTTNSLRPQTGSLWNQILARSQTQQTIDTSNPIPTPQTGLPKPVAQNRFGISRVPDTGSPSYVAIYKTPLPNTDPSARPLRDVINSLRTYQQGLAIVQALHLPDVHFHDQINKQVESLYTDLGDIQSLAPDTTAQADSLDVLDPEVLKAAVFAELSADIIPDLRNREHAVLVEAYKKGEITQIFLDRDLGRFRGELHFDDQSSIDFDIDVDTVTQIMNLPKTDDLPPEIQ